MESETKTKAFAECIYKRIEDLAKENNLVIGRWAIKGGLTPSTIYGLKGSGKIPNIITIKYLCEAINIELNEFFDVEYLKDFKLLD